MRKMTRKELIEALSAKEHDQWNSACPYIIKTVEPLFQGLTGGRTPAQMRSEAALERWGRQAKTPYLKLSEAEKESDRKFALLLLPLIDAYVRSEKLAMIEAGRKLHVVMTHPRIDNQQVLDLIEKKQNEPSD
jgi:hypothetical protein